MFVFINLACVILHKWICVSYDCLYMDERGGGGWSLAVPTTYFGWDESVIFPAVLCQEISLKTFHVENVDTHIHV